MELTKEQIAAAQAQLNNQIQDIDFEDSPNVDATKEEEIPKTDSFKQSISISANPTIGYSLKISRDLIADIKEEYAGLSITSITDKDGIATVGNALKRVKGIARNIEKKREELKAPILQAGRDLDLEAKELSALVKEIIDPLEREDARIKLLLKEEETKVQREQEKLMNDRLAVLKEMGVVQQGVFYCIGQTVSITPDVLKTMDVLEWDKLLTKVEEANKEEEKKRQKEEAEKAELINARKELEEIKESLSESRMTMRLEMIKMLGYKPKSINPGIYDLTSSEFPDVIVNVTWDHVSQYDDATFMKCLTENKERFDRIVTSRTILKGKQDRLILRGETLVGLGMSFNYHIRGWRYKECMSTCYQDTISDLTEAEFKEVVSEMEKKITDYELKIKVESLEEQKKEHDKKLMAELNREKTLPCAIELKSLLDSFYTKYGHSFILFPTDLLNKWDDLHYSIDSFITPYVEESPDMGLSEDFGDPSQF
jgi:hypothetical protein